MTITEVFRFKNVLIPALAIFILTSGCSSGIRGGPRDPLVRGSNGDLMNPKNKEIKEVATENTHVIWGTTKEISLFPFRLGYRINQGCAYRAVVFVQH